MSQLDEVGQGHSDMTDQPEDGLGVLPNTG